MEEEIKDLLETSLQQNDEIGKETNSLLEGILEQGKEISDKLDKKEEIEQLDSSIVKIYKGDKGDKGDTPVKGKDYYTEKEKKEIISYLLKEIKTLTPKKGKDYFTPKEIQDIINKVIEEIPENDIDYQLIIKEVIKQLPKPKEIKQESVDKLIEKIKGRLSYNDLKDLPAIFKGMAGTGYLNDITDVKINNPQANQALVYNPSTKLWENSLISSTFTGLTDTPDSYSGQSGKVVSVKSTEDGLEFKNISDVIYNKVLFIKNEAGTPIQDAIDSINYSDGRTLLLLDAGIFSEATITITDKPNIDISGIAPRSTDIKKIIISNSVDDASTQTISNLNIEDIDITFGCDDCLNLVILENILNIYSFTATGANNFYSLLKVKNSTIYPVATFTDKLFVTSEHTGWAGFTISGDTVFQHSSGELNGTITLNNTSQAIIRNDGVLAFPLISFVTFVVNDTAVLNIDSVSRSTSIVQNNTGTEASIQIQEGYSAGIISPKPVITDNGNGTINIGQGQCFIYDNDHNFGSPIRYIIPAQTNLVLTDGYTNYISVNYNSGSPIYSIGITNTRNESDIIPVADYYREGTILHEFDWDALGEGLANKLHLRILGTQSFARSTGLGLSESPTRLVIIGSGSGFNGAVPLSFDAFTSATDSFDFWYKTGGVWTKNATTTQYNNTQYQGASNLVSALPNKYLINFIFRGLETDAHTYYVLGTQEYANTAAGLVSAQEAQVPNDLPGIIRDHTFLVGKIIVLTSASTATSIQSAFATQFQITPATDHGSLGGLTDDDHTQYLLLAGRAGGQAIIGGTLTTQGLTIRPNAADLTTGQVDFLGTLDASSSTVASATFAGGVGIAKNLIVNGGTLYVDATNNRVGVGITPASKFHFASENSNNTFIGGCYSDTATHRNSFNFQRFRGSIASPTAVASGDQINGMFSVAYDGTSNITVSSIEAFVDTYTTTNNLSGYLRLSTRNDGVGAALTERMRISKEGYVGIGTTTPTHALTFPTASTGIALYNTADQTTNYERGEIYWASNVFLINSTASGSGTNRILRLKQGSTSTVSVDINSNAGSASGFLSVTRSTGGTNVNHFATTGATTASSGVNSFITAFNTINQSGTAGYNVFFCNITETTTGSGAKNLILAQVGGVDRFKFCNQGCLILSQTAGLSEASSISFNEKDTTPANPTDGTEIKHYMKDNKIIFQYNEGGTIRYKYLDMTGTGVTWVHTTTAP